MHAFERKLRQLRKRLIFDSGDYRRSVILAGTGRSGTTWTEEIINSRNDFRILFEPFHSNKVDLLSEWNYRQYLRCNDHNDKFLKPAASILAGEIRNAWIDQFNQRIFSRKRLIKDIRIQLLLKWIKCHFPEIPVILLLRHPCAVANSKLKLGWETHLHDFLGQDELMNDHLDPFRQELESAKILFDKHIFMWCVENYVPLKQFNKGEIIVVFYEDLCTNPQKEIERIFAFIKEDFSSSLLERFTKPSALAQKDSAIISGTDLIGTWRKSISDKQIQRASEILGIFGLQAIYDQSSFPLLSGDAALEVFSD